MKYLLLLPLALQALAILVEELHFHLARAAALALLWPLYHAPATGIEANQ